LLFEKSDSSTR